MYYRLRSQKLKKTISQSSLLISEPVTNLLLNQNKLKSLNYISNIHTLEIIDENKILDLSQSIDTNIYIKPKTPPESPPPLE